MTASKNETKGNNIFYKIRIAWKNRSQIIEGIRNNLFKKYYVERIAKQRKELCESNLCGLYEIIGANEKCFVKGQPCCGGCGCKLAWKQRSLASHCYLKDIGKKPIWDAVLTQEREDELYKKHGVENK